VPFVICLLEVVVAFVALLHTKSRLSPKVVPFQKLVAPSAKALKSKWNIIYMFSGSKHIMKNAL